MPAKAISGILAVFWGVGFVQLFRYTLDSLYPFWADKFSLTFLGYGIAFLVWLSFWRFFPRHLNPEHNRLGWLYPVLAILNTGLFLLATYLLGSTGFLYTYPLIFSLLLALQMFLFTSTLPRYIPYRGLVLAGMAVALIPWPVLSNPWFLFPATLLPLIMPQGWLPPITLPTIRHKTRLLPLRLGLDFLRFLFLALSLYGIFDILRERFYPVMAILLSGAIAQQLVLHYLPKKEHIKFGLLILGPLLAILGILFAVIPFSFSAAMGYAMLSVWEAVYFKRAPEGYLKREQLLAGIILLLSLALTFVSYPWATILCGALVTIVLVRIFLYLLRKYRQVLGFVFLLAIAAWSISVYVLQKSQVTRDFWAEHKMLPPPKDVYDPIVLFSSLPGQKIKTNLYKELNLENLPAVNGKNIGNLNVPPVFLTAFLAWHTVLGSDTAIVLTAQGLGPYNRDPGWHYLEQYISQLNNSAILLLKSPPANHNTTKGMDLAPQLQPNQLDAYRNLVMELAEKYNQQQQPQQALALYRIAEKHLGNDPLLFRQMALVCGNAGDLECQIHNLVKYMNLRKDAANTEEKLLLLELLYLQGNLEGARSMAEDLLKQDKNRSIIYLGWIFKTMKNETDQYKWQQFYYRVKNFPVGENEREQREKNQLIENIEEAIRANPRFHDVFLQEQKRQEFIQFPE